jgi:hypothetical protein
VIKASPQERSRHLSRLGETGLIRKNSGGLYGVTPLGVAIQTLFPSIRFFLRHRANFLSHDLSFLPRGLVERMGELSAREHVNHFSQVLDKTKAAISGHWNTSGSSLTADRCRNRRGLERDFANMGHLAHIQDAEGRVMGIGQSRNGSQEGRPSER